MARPKMILTAEQVLTRKAMAWATKIRVNPTRIVIAELETRWGSCAPDGIVALAGDLVDMLEDFQDYVVVHELLYLRYRSHGKAFTAMVTALVPGWRDLEASSFARENFSDRRLLSVPAASFVASTRRRTDAWSSCTSLRSMCARPTAPASLQPTFAIEF